MNFDRLLVKAKDRRIEKYGKDYKRLYSIWCSMIQRCSNARRENYKYYGGRGIKVVYEWGDFEVFADWAIENGYNANLQIDRIDNDAGYGPGNCQWVTAQRNCAIGKRRKQSNNKTGVTGVLKNRHNTYEAYISISGSQKYLGSYKTLEEAAEVRKEAERCMHEI